MWIVDKKNSNLYVSNIYVPPLFNNRPLTASLYTCVWSEKQRMELEGRLNSYVKSDDRL